MRALLAVAVLAATLAGCVGLGPTQEPVCAAEPYELLTVPTAHAAGARAADPRQAWDGLIRATPADRVDVSVESTPDGWSAELEDLAADGNLSRLRLTPDDPDAGSVVPAWQGTGDACRSGHRSWSLADPSPGEVAGPGQGVHVHTAGFWDNGTLFYTNIDAVHRSDWPRAEWYDYGGDAPLPVYVYDEDPDEKPPWWTAAVPGDVPVAGGTTLWNYYVTIPGFNDALKGLSDATTRVVRMPPEQAYTRPGNEDHALYGDALTFYIVIEEVVDRPCRTTAGDLCPIAG